MAEQNIWYPPSDFKEKLYALAFNGNSVPQIGDYFGVSKSTIDKQCKENKEYRKALLKGRADARNELMSNAMTMAKNNATLMIFLLKVKAGWREDSFDDTDDSEPLVPPMTREQALELLKKKTAEIEKNVSKTG